MNTDSNYDSSFPRALRQESKKAKQKNFIISIWAIADLGSTRIGETPKIVSAPLYERQYIVLLSKPVSVWDSCYL